jgi:uncharacterized protein with von Willebrand factor type A (vWA) domain
MTRVPPSSSHRLGGVIHTYQAYNAVEFPNPMTPPPDLVSGAMNHFLMFGDRAPLTREELARAVRLNPDQIKGLGPSLDALIAMLEERKRRILAKYETAGVQKSATKQFHESAARMKPPPKLQKAFEREVRNEQLRDLEHLWYAAGDEQSPFATDLLKLVAMLGDKYQVDALAANYVFTGRDELSIPKAIEVKKELEQIDRLLKQLREARKNAQIALIDMEELSQFADPGDMEQLQALRQQVEDYLKHEAGKQGLEFTREGYQLTPHAMRIFQSRLLQSIFEELKASRSGRHEGPIVGEGAVEMSRTKSYEFGDSLANMDVVQSMVNAMIRERGEPSPPASDRRRVRMTTDDLEIHLTRNSPKCATAVIMDMSGSMRYDGLYVHCKRMGLALDGLIRREYPGDFLQFIEMASFAKARHVSEIPSLMPKPVTVFSSVVRLKADMSNPDISEFDVPPHFTNIQHALLLARRFLAVQSTPNRQIILITDGLPTAHFEAQHLYLLYPPHPRTEEATMREAMACKRDGIVINVFLLPNWNQTHDDVQFAQRMVESTRGRVFFTGGSDLDRFVVWDYVSRRRSIVA